ncbi:MAG: peptidylprolyl isomerase [Desulfobacteraceae bacterium]|nr:peptidylprolyl isomerase [Desulfobacteraceae bacterium]MCF8095271.1 peptidylprolyl isomerase [Desulfobacteraceae bacterium]
MNYSEKALEDEIEQNLAIRKLIDKKFGSDISVTDKDIESYYKENKKEFEVPEKVRARHILIKSDPDADDAKKAEAKEKIKELQEKLEDGEDFSELAKKHSEGPSAESGGDLGYFSQGQMVKDFEEVVFDMKTGEVSDIVKTDFGYHLIKLEDRKEEGTQPLDEVRDSIRQDLEREKTQQKLEPYLESLKQKFPVERNLPGADQG